jgi:hypothetical protein
MKTPKKEQDRSSDDRYASELSPTEFPLSPYTFLSVVWSACCDPRLEHFLDKIRRQRTWYDWSSRIHINGHPLSFLHCTQSPN